MNTCTFVLPPHSPLQRVKTRSHPKTVLTVFLVVIAHVILFLAFLFPGSRSNRFAEMDVTKPAGRPLVVVPSVTTASMGKLRAGAASLAAQERRPNLPQ